MDIPKIGGARGIFDIFVPGLFLWFNGIAVVYLSPWSSTKVRGLIEGGVSSDLPLGISLSIVFGYLAGVLLRLLRCERLDRASAWWLHKFNKHYILEAVKPEQPGASAPVQTDRQVRPTFKRYAVERFPYIGWVEYVCSEYYKDDAATKFFILKWQKAKPSEPDRHGNQQFFNLRKVSVISRGGMRAAEVYAAEALTRYMAGMFHAMACAGVAMFLLACSRAMVGQRFPELCLLSAAYFAASVFILKEFRFIRIKEVETLFAADLDLDSEKAEPSAAQAGKTEDDDDD